ncbi:unnamed protein product [Linum trigynum]|uniref:Uncharacterized protein n=1 Tax=Linum trigynum TaxID=586398 RepID=A0AAV2GC52_9ROSI
MPNPTQLKPVGWGTSTGNEKVPNYKFCPPNAARKRFRRARKVSSGNTLEKRGKAEKKPAQLEERWCGCRLRKC